MVHTSLNRAVNPGGINRKKSITSINRLPVKLVIRLDELIKTPDSSKMERMKNNKTGWLTDERNSLMP